MKQKFGFIKHNFIKVKSSQETKEKFDKHYDEAD